METRLRLQAILIHRDLDFLDTHLPLGEAEQARRVRPNWPTVGVLWDCLRDREMTTQNNIDAIWAACRRLSPGLSLDLHKVWNTWLHRAKAIVARQTASDLQERLFAYLYPRHRGNRSERNSRAQ